MLPRRRRLFPVLSASSASSNPSSFPFVVFSAPPATTAGPPSPPLLAVTPIIHQLVAEDASLLPSRRRHPERRHRRRHLQAPAQEVDDAPLHVNPLPQPAGGRSEKTTPLQPSDIMHAEGSTGDTPGWRRRRRAGEILRPIPFPSLATHPLGMCLSSGNTISSYRFPADVSAPTRRAVCRQWTFSSMHPWTSMRSPAMHPAHPRTLLSAYPEGLSSGVPCARARAGRRRRGTEGSRCRSTWGQQSARRRARGAWGCEDAVVGRGRCTHHVSLRVVGVVPVPRGHGRPGHRRVEHPGRPRERQRRLRMSLHRWASRLLHGPLLPRAAPGGAAWGPGGQGWVAGGAPGTPRSSTRRWPPAPGRRRPGRRRTPPRRTGPRPRRSRGGGRPSLRRRARGGSCRGCRAGGGAGGGGGGAGRFQDVSFTRRHGRKRVSTSRRCGFPSQAPRLEHGEPSAAEELRPHVRGDRPALRARLRVRTSVHGDHQRERARARRVRGGHVQAPVQRHPAPVRGGDLRRASGARELSRPGPARRGLWGGEGSGNLRAWKNSGGRSRSRRARGSGLSCSKTGRSSTPEMLQSDTRGGDWRGGGGCGGGTRASEPDVCCSQSLG